MEIKKKNRNEGYIYEGVFINMIRKNNSIQTISCGEKMQVSIMKLINQGHQS